MKKIARHYIVIIYFKIEKGYSQKLDLQKFRASKMNIFDGRNVGFL